MSAAAFEALEAYEAEFNYWHHTPQINQQTQDYQSFFWPTQVFSHTFSCEQHEEGREVKTEAVAKLGEAHGAVRNQDG